MMGENREKMKKQFNKLFKHFQILQFYFNEIFIHIERIFTLVRVDLWIENNLKM